MTPLYDVKLKTMNRNIVTTSRSQQIQFGLNWHKNIEWDDKIITDEYCNVFSKIEQYVKPESKMKKPP